MPYRCANPACQFTHEAMRGICLNPDCLRRSVPGCGRYFRCSPDGSVAALSPDMLPPENDSRISWLCCYCAMEYEVVGPGHLRPATDPFAFVWRWEVESAGASPAHELG